MKRHLGKTTIAVLVFIILLVVAGYSRAGDGFRISVGQSVFNSHLMVGEVGYEINNWEFNAATLETGNTKNGNQDQLWIFSTSYLTKPQNFRTDWAQPFLRLGVSYNDGSTLIGDTNFRLGAGVDFSDVWRVEYSHHSSAGIHSPNTGLDYITVTYKMPNMW